MRRAWATAKPAARAGIPSWKAPAAQGLKYAPDEMARVTHPLKLPDPREVDDPDPTIRVQKALDALCPGWKTSTNGPDMHPGYVAFAETIFYGQLDGVIRTHPPKRGEEVRLTRTLVVPTGSPKLRFKVGNSPKGDFRLIVRVNGAEMLSTRVGDTKNDNRSNVREYVMSLEPWAGRDATVELVNVPTGWNQEAALWNGIEITSNND